jgi:hypothetical protein
MDDPSHKQFLILPPRKCLGLQSNPNLKAGVQENPGAA